MRSEHGSESDGCYDDPLRSPLPPAIQRRSPGPSRGDLRTPNWQPLHSPLPRKPCRTPLSLASMSRPATCTSADLPPSPTISHHHLPPPSPTTSPHHLPPPPPTTSHHLPPSPTSVMDEHLLSPPLWHTRAPPPAPLAHSTIAHSTKDHSAHPSASHSTYHNALTCAHLVAGGDAALRATRAGRPPVLGQDVPIQHAPIQHVPIQHVPIQHVPIQHAPMGSREMVYAKSLPDLRPLPPRDLSMVHVPRGQLVPPHSQDVQGARHTTSAVPSWLVRADGRGRARGLQPLEGMVLPMCARAAALKRPLCLQRFRQVLGCEVELEPRSPARASSKR